MKKLLLFFLFPAAVVMGQNQFSEVSVSAGIDKTGSNYGVAIADFDQDGWEDIFVARTQDENILYHNNGDGTFVNIATQSGLNFFSESRVAASGDFNNDGWPDLFIGSRAGIRDRMLINRQDGTFQDVSILARTISSIRGNAMAVLLADVDNDSFLDIYVTRMNAQNTLYRNRGDLTLEDITYASGATDTLVAMGGIFFDYDQDRDQDLYLVHDNYQGNILYRNNGDLTFTDVSGESETDYEGFGMGVDAGDVNNDGWMDLYITNLYNNVLFLNNGDGTFANITRDAGTGDYGMGWGTFFFDTDNDGWQDIYVANTPYPNVLYRNQGDLTFLSIGKETVLASAANSYGAVPLDYDRDGLTDIFITNGFGATGNQLFHNENNPTNHWVKFSLEGTTSNRTAVGARVEVFAAGNRRVDEIHSGSGYVSQNSLIAHFGLGESEFVDSVIVFWPGGSAQTYKNLSANRTHILRQGNTIGSDLVEGKRLMAVPNPFYDQMSVYFSLTTPTTFTLQITDLAGRRVYFFNGAGVQAGLHEVPIPTETLLPSFYICTLITPEETRQIKICKRN
ncbi:MAG: FG-GAP-like repeat-containing protein [Bacteroidia bacterium]